MSVYQLHFYDQAGRRPMLDFAECEDDGAAAHAAFRNLRQHMSCIGVEVYEGERLVARVERPSGEFAAFSRGVHGVG